MKKFLGLSIFLAFTTPAVAQVATETMGTPAAAATPALNCSGGVAATKKYAGNFWLVSGCSDGKSLVFVASEGNPARPFTITGIMSNGARSFSASGTGDKAAADAALAEIEKLSEQDIAALIDESKGAK